MSDVLTSDTPADDPAVTAPESEAAADAGSVNSPEVIPAERFNGLMSRYNSDKSSWEAERDALRTEVERLSQAEMETPVVSDDGLDEVRALRAELAAERMGRARAQALVKYPGAAPLADLIVGDNPEDIERMASILQERLTTLTSPGAAADAGATTEDAAPAAAATAPAVPIVGGAVTVDDSASADDAIAEAVKNRDFAALIAAQTQRALEAQGADLTVG